MGGGHFRWRKWHKSSGGAEMRYLSSRVIASHETDGWEAEESLAKRVEGNHEEKR